MIKAFALRGQRGATLIVGLIMLAVITLLVISAFTLSSTNLQSVGNMQFRAEAIAATNKAIEQVLSSPFITATTDDQIDVDLNNDGKPDYSVVIRKPTCVKSLEQTGASAARGKASSVQLNLPTGPSTYNTVWDIDATVTDPATGASVRVHQGVRVILNQTQYTAVCA